MNKEKDLYQEFVGIIEFPVKSHLLNTGDRPTLERYRVLRTQLEDVVDKYVELKREDEFLGEHYRELLAYSNKKDEILNTIIQKDVEIGLIKGILHADKSLHTASYYNSHFPATYRHLTQEEFDSFKEVLVK